MQLDKLTISHEARISEHTCDKSQAIRLRISESLRIISRQLTVCFCATFSGSSIDGDFFASVSFSSAFSAIDVCLLPRERLTSDGCWNRLCRLFREPCRLSW